MNNSLLHVRMDMKKDWSLWLAVALPFVMILFVAASIYVPRLWAPQPQYGFLYRSSDTSGGYTVASYDVQVKKGKLVKQEVDRSGYKDSDSKTDFVEPQLYRYDAMTGESESLTFEEAEALTVDDRKKSPDDFEVSQGGGGSFLFGGGSGSYLYLIGHSLSRKLDLRGIDSSYDFEFIGWITK